MRARLGAYGYWQLRDFVFERAAAILLVIGLWIWLNYESTQIARTSVFVAGGTHALEFGANILSQTVSLSWILCALLAVHGISSNERTTGRFRLLFAKPVSVVRFHAQGFALHFLAYMLCAAIGVAVFTRFFPVSSSSVAGALAIYLDAYLLVGGVCFLFSAIWRFDWLSTGVVLGVVSWLASNHPGAWWLEPLPPFGIIFEQVTVLGKYRPLETGPLLWVAAYGVACFLLGLIILKRRPLAP
jgi:ABC-type transport system involved in multi-copper enzyme maturation permease subunit